MTHATPEERFRQLAEMEDGMPVSAGGRVSHEQAHVTAGRGVFLDLTAIPEAQRPAVVSELQEVIRKATVADTSVKPIKAQPQSS
jgi:hypothetical protein